MLTKSQISFSLPLGAWERFRYLIVALPVPSINETILLLYCNTNANISDKLSEKYDVCCHGSNFVYVLPTSVETGHVISNAFVNTGAMYEF